MESAGAEGEGSGQAAPQQPACGKQGRRVGRLVESGQPVRLAQPEDFDFPLNRPEVRVGRYQLRLFLLAGP